MDEHQLVNMRPEDLPVPVDGETDDDSEIALGQRRGATSSQVPHVVLSPTRRVMDARKRSRTPTMRSEVAEELVNRRTPSAQFQTPASWERPTGKGRGEQGVEKTKVQIKKRESNLKSKRNRDGSLERELEKTMFKQVMKRNAELADHVKFLESKLQERSNRVEEFCSPQGPAVSLGPQGPQAPPVPSTPPRNVTEVDVNAEVRFTPGGTPVPLGPPRTEEPEVPAWPDSLGDYYDQVHVARTAVRSDAQWRPTNSSARSRWGRNDCFLPDRSMPGYGGEQWCRSMAQADDRAMSTFEHRHDGRAPSNRDHLCGDRAFSTSENRCDGRAPSIPEHLHGDRAVSISDLYAEIGL